MIAAVVAASTWSPVATAQRAEKTYRIGFLRRTSPEPAHFEAFLQGLRGLGYVEGQNVVIEQRYAHGAHERLPALARELLELKVDVFVVDGPLTVRAVRQVAQATPVVFTVVSDPVGAGFATTLARPGGASTGLTLQSADLIPKRLQLLREIVPVGGVGILYNPPNTPAPRLEELKEAARSLGVELTLVEIRRPDTLTGAFATMRQAGLGAVLVWNDAMLYSQRKRIVDLAAEHKLPAVYEERAFAEAGGLISYGPNQSENFRRAAAFVDKIRKGAKPGDIPIEQPAKFDLVINLKTAGALGITIPPVLLLRADHVVR